MTKHSTILKEYRRGEADRAAKRPPTPPKHGDHRKAYLNGYYGGAR